MNKALTSPISRSAIALGKMSAISLIAAMQASLILGIALAIGVSFPNPIMIAPIMAIVILFSLGFSGISVMIAATAKSQETFWGLINFLGMPLFMLSPALFPLELLPDWLASVAKLNPVTYTVLLVREMMTGVSEGGVSAFLSIGVICVFVLIMVGLASYVFTREVNKPF
jgi:ABC-2 type transport system permease protein